MQDIAASIGNSLSRDAYGGMRANLPMSGHKVTDLGPGTDDTDAVTVAQLSGAGLPLGVCVDFAGAVAPTNWLLCYGQAVSRVTYADLFAAIGTVHGTGDGSTTFNLPDYRGRASAGKDDMGGSNASRLSEFSGTTLGAGVGAQNQTLTTAQMPSHDHGAATGSAGAHSHTIGFDQYFGFVPGGGGAGPYYPTTSGAASTSGAADHTHSIAAQGGGDAHPNVQPTIIMNKIIKAVAG